MLVYQKVPHHTLLFYPTLSLADQSVASGLFKIWDQNSWSKTVNLNDFNGSKGVAPMTAENT